MLRMYVENVIRKTAKFYRNICMKVGLASIFKNEPIYTNDQARK